MSKSKERKISKIKNKKVWPFVMVIFLIVILFMGLSFALLASGYSFLIVGKKRSISQTTLIVKNTFMECRKNGVDFADASDTMYNYLQDLRGIVVVDEDNRPIMQYGGIEPDFSNYVYAYDDGLVDDPSAELYEFWLAKEPRVVGEGVDVSLEADYWTVYPLDDGTKLCIHVPIILYNYEILAAAAIIVVFSIIMLLLVCWNIFMIIRVLIERSRERDILYTSTVTGGNNMQYFKDRAELLLREKNHAKRCYALVSIRLQKYQNYCSCYGIKEGEELLEDLFHGIVGCLKKKEIAAHESNADFVMLLRCDDEENLTGRLEGLTGSLKKVRPDMKLNFGVGIYLVPKKHEDIGTMCNYSAMVLDTIQEDMEDHISTFDESMLADQRWVRMLEDDMERALENHEFQVYLQPKYSAREEKIAGAEALVRWIHPTEGFIAPNRFIPHFERNGFILRLDDFMLTEVAKLQSKWLSEGKKIVPISVNVSRAHFTMVDLAEHICQLVDQYNVPHDMIELELTESAFFDDKSILVNTVKKLKGFGFDISMDDFGAGYSSLNSLKELPLDVLKLDAEFFRGEDSDGRGDLIVGESISLAKKLDMRIVAEGIETREQVDSLAEKNCDLIQGYFFAKPMPVADFENAAFGAAV